jgi:hypothetical protein
MKEKLELSPQQGLTTETPKKAELLRNVKGCLFKAGLAGVGLGAVFVGGAIVLEKVTRVSPLEKYGPGYDQQIPL